MSTSAELWLNPDERHDKPVVIFEQDNVRVTVDGKTAYFETRNADRVGVERWEDAESDWALRKILTILAKQQIELAKRRNIDEPARQD